nr:MAG TPA: hypothetical protein [Caudoviricetes sp.]DAZ55753.1 MAG TPA: hypothetical protein [Caudoviricetes sp.]
MELDRSTTAINARNVSRSKANVSNCKQNVYIA